MQNESRRYAALAAVAVIGLALGGCNERARDTSGAVDRPPGDTASAGSRAEAAGSGLTDANIVALLDEANKADSAAGAYALTKATNPEVKNFAKLMMGEHHALRAQGQQLAKQLNVTPQPPANDPVKPLAESEMSALRAAPKGAQFDRTYIDQEVTAHKAVLDLAKKAHDEADNEQLKKLIEQAQPVIEKHLEMAEDLQKKLGGSST